MKTYTQEELNKILELHKKWLMDEDGGVRADLRNANLRCADLRCANLRCADLRCANLRHANLRHANLRCADLRHANLRHANLKYADLSDADLSNADLSNADLYNADLGYADLYNADLGYAKNIFLPMACPDSGSFVGWKKALSDLVVGRRVIVKLEILEDAKRSSATGRKCRCDKAKVLEIQNLDKNKKCDITEAYAQHDNEFKYTVGETVSVDNFEDDRYIECAPGIHFFINREEAVRY